MGATYTTTAITIDGYTLKTTPANASGKHTSADIFVTYVYSKTDINTGNNNSNADSDNDENLVVPPATGDGSQTSIWLLMMIMSALGIMLTRKKFFDARD